MTTVKELREILEQLPDDLQIWIATFSGRRVNAKPVTHVLPVNMGGFLQLDLASSVMRPINRPCLLDWLQHRSAEFPQFAAEVCKFHKAKQAEKVEVKP